MEKTRVSKGENYWYIDEFGRVQSCTDNYEPYPSLVRFKTGNYFLTKEEAKSMAHKLNAVLKGADVIETPSEEEISKQATDIAWNRQDDYYDEEGNVIQCYGECYDSAKDMYKWLKSKIVK